MGQTCIKVDNDFGEKSRYKRGVLGPLSREAKFKQDANTQSKHNGEDVICGMRGRIRT